MLQASAFTVAGEGPMSEVKNLTYGIPRISSYVGDLKWQPIGNHSINISWSAPQRESVVIDQYVVEYYDAWDTRVTMTIKKTSIQSKYGFQGHGFDNLLSLLNFMSTFECDTCFHWILIGTV